MSEKDLFREDFKRFKNKNVSLEISEIVDFDAKLPSLILHERKINNVGNSCSLCFELGLRDHKSWEINSLSGLNGFLHLKNPFTADGQNLWVGKCLRIYPQKPSKTNLDLQNSSVNDALLSCKSDNFAETKFPHKLSWCTLGYHHNWDTKVYDTNDQSPFPDCLQKLSRHVAGCLGFDDFIPEAAIVNFYGMKSNLGIHNDHSEQNLNAPILSLSFGQTAIFLIGTCERTEKPSAVFLRSGDIVLMFGPSRLAYHAVPRIISEDVRSRYIQSKDDLCSPYEEYLNTNRINVSVRQVY